MGIKYNLISGFFAALAGVHAKYGFDFSEESDLAVFVKQVMTQQSLSMHHSRLIVCTLIHPPSILEFLKYL